MKSIKKTYINNNNIITYIYLLLTNIFSYSTYFKNFTNY